MSPATAIGKHREARSRVDSPAPMPPPAIWIQLSDSAAFPAFSTRAPVSATALVFCRGWSRLDK